MRILIFESTLYKELDIADIAVDARDCGLDMRTLVCRKQRISVDSLIFM